MPADGVLRTARLTLAPWAAADLPDLHAMFSEPDVCRYLCDGEVMPREWVDEQIRGSESRFAAGSLGVWAGRDTGGRLVGFAGFVPIGPEGRIELVFAVRTGFMRQGYGEELARAALEQAWAARLSEIKASTDEPNAASLRLLAKLGMKREGTSLGSRWRQHHLRLLRGRRRRSGYERQR